MNEEMYVVVIDTRGMSPSDIDGYEEHVYTEDYFDNHILRRGERVHCVKSKVAELCGLNMKIYFHDYCELHAYRYNTARDGIESLKIAVSHEEDELDKSNSAATLLTFDPRTGFPEFKIMGKAYAVVDCGDYPLSNHQVWGLQELISEARDFYHCDPDHALAGRLQLMTFCEEYKRENWGPLTIYEPRLVVEEGHPHDFPNKKQPLIAEDYYHHRHEKPKHAYVLKDEHSAGHEEPIMIEPHRAKAKFRFAPGRLARFAATPLDFDEDDIVSEDDENRDDDDTNRNSVSSILATTKCYRYRI